SLANLQSLNCARILCLPCLLSAWRHSSGQSIVLMMFCGQRISSMLQFTGLIECIEQPSSYLQALSTRSFGSMPNATLLTTTVCWLADWLIVVPGYRTY